MSVFQTPFQTNRHACVRIVVAAAVIVCVLAGFVKTRSTLAGDLTVVPDECAAEQGGTPKEEPKTSGAAQHTHKQDTSLELQKQAAYKRVHATLEEEDGRMAEVIHPMDRESAAVWLSSFISEKPLNCPNNEQHAWIQSILDGVERNQIPICREICGLVATLIAIESSFRTDPLAVDASRGEKLTRLLERTEYEFLDKYGALVQLPGVHQVYQAYRDKYYPKLAACKTEGQVDALARNIAEDLKRDSSALPGPIRGIIHKELDKLVYVVRTKGSMQLNFTRARDMMKERGEQFTARELVDYMYTRHGGIDVGIAALKPMFMQYAACYGKPDDMSWLFFVGMDYHYGPFSSRNMMEQIRIRDLSGHKIAIDGDFLHYDDKGRPANQDSETLKAVEAIFPRLSRSTILNALLLEKDRHYIYSNLHQAVMDAHRERFGDTPFAVIGDLWMGHSAQLKHGATWKTHSYLHKLDRYLNSLPWDRAAQ